MPDQPSHRARFTQVAGILLLRGVPFWQQSRGRRLARLAALMCYVYLATPAVLLALPIRQPFFLSTFPLRLLSLFLGFQECLQVICSLFQHGTLIWIDFCSAVDPTDEWRGHSILNVCRIGTDLSRLFPARRALSMEFVRK